MCSEFQERTLTSVINEFGEETVKCVLSNFICKKNVEVEEYLHNKAIYHELKGLARTILIFDPNNGMQLVGYYTISTKSFVIDIKLNTSQKKKYFGISKTNGNTLPSFLIGQLGKNEVVESEFNGDILMDYIFRYIKKMYKHTPSVITYVYLHYVQHT